MLERVPKSVLPQEKHTYLIRTTPPPTPLIRNFTSPTHHWKAHSNPKSTHTYLIRNSSPSLKLEISLPPSPQYLESSHKSYTYFES